MISELFETKSE